MPNKVAIGFILVLSLIFNLGCDDSGVEADSANSKIFGSVLYLDGSAGKFAQIQLRKLTSSLLVYVSANENGEYEFSDLEAGEYRVRFQSSSSDVYTYERELTLSEGQSFEQNIFILYKKIDEFNALQKNSNVFLIKFQPEGGKIGTNYQYVEYLSGNYSRDQANQYTLSSDIYKIPNTLNWQSADSLFFPDFVRENYEYVTSIDEINTNGNHEIRFVGEDLVKILSNPVNGFVFVNKSVDEKELKIPCVDFINNDFGLIINYK